MSVCLTRKVESDSLSVLFLENSTQDSEFKTSVGDNEAPGSQNTPLQTGLPRASKSIRDKSKGQGSADSKSDLLSSQVVLCGNATPQCRGHEQDCVYSVSSVLPALC